MTILVQSFLNSATKLATTATTATTVAQLKTLVYDIEGVSTSIMEFYIKDNSSTTATALVSGTLGSYGITTATTIYSSNTISTSTSKIDRQLAKLELARLRRQAAGDTSATFYRSNNIYDVDLLADKYTSNTSTVGTTSTLVVARPWTDAPPTSSYTIEFRSSIIVGEADFEPGDIITTCNEGDIIFFFVIGVNVPDDENAYLQFGGANITNQDAQWQFGENILDPIFYNATGTATNGAPILIEADNLTEGNETLTLSWTVNGEIVATNSVTIVDTSTSGL